MEPAALVQMKIPMDLKPYDIAVNEDDDSAEVNLYGEVVTNIPTDWWGDRIEGLYIVLADFLNDMETLKNKSSVTFHINSPGGEVFAGISIYNRMKEFTGKVVTVVDGLAASAASIIAQGATPGNRYVCNGTLTMIHGAASFMFGYYNSNEMRDSIKQLDAIDKSIAEIYASTTGQTSEQTRAWMKATTWMSAQDAIDKGFADAIKDDGQSAKMMLNSAKSVLNVNGVPMAVRGWQLPDFIPIAKETPKPKVTTGTEPDVIKNNKNLGGKTKMTREELMQSDPELVNEIRTEAINSVQGSNEAAIQAAVQAEVDRLKSIDEIANKIADKELVNKAKYGETKMTAGDLALEALKNQQDAGAQFINNMKQDASQSGTDGVKPVPNSNLPQEEQDKADIDAGAALIAGLVK